MFTNQFFPKPGQLYAKPTGSDEEWSEIGSISVDGVSLNDCFGGEPITGADIKKLGEPELNDLVPFEDQVQDILSDVYTMLLEKNEAYGNSALEPARIFSKADATEQLYVRADDKLSRIKNDQGNDDEDAVLDLIGYLVLIMIARESVEIDE